MCPQTQKVITIPTIWASIKKKKKKRDTFVAQGRNRTSSDSAFIILCAHVCVSVCMCTHMCELFTCSRDFLK